MKNAILLAISLFTISLKAQEVKTWRLGASLGLNGNHANFSGGMQEANARFSQNSFGTAALDFIARYDYNTHWMAQFSMGFSSTGYEFSLAENYSLLNKSKQYSTLQSDFGKFELPAMLFYKFNPNCKNSKWLIGAGFVYTIVEGKTVKKNFDESNEGNSNSNYLTATSTAEGGSSVLFRWSIAREKMFKNGSALNAALVFNVGLSEMTSAKVNYTVDNQLYEHSFSSNGNFVGFRISYFLRSLGSTKLK